MENEGLLIPFKLPVRLPEKVAPVLLGAVRLTPGVDGVGLFEDRLTLDEALIVHLPPLLPRIHRKKAAS